MPTQAGVGRSTHRDPRTAGREAGAAARAALGGDVPHFCLVFATARYDQAELIAAVRSIAPGARLSGCSGEGVIAGSTSDEGEYAVGVMAIRSDTLEFLPLLARDYSADPAAAGERLAAEALACCRGDELALFLLPDGLLGNCGRLLGALDGALGGRVPMLGGTAGDAMTLERTFQYRDGEVTSDAVAGVLVRGRGRFEFAVSHGCTQIGIERCATRTDGGWLHEIDGRPAWDVFREYLGPGYDDLNAEGMAHLCIGEPLPDDAATEHEPFVIHTPLGLDKRTGSLFFPGGGVAQATRIHFTRRDPVRVRSTARECAARVARRVPERRPALVLQFDCAGRGRMLFGSRSTEEIVWPLQEQLGPGVPWIGFHTYGEIAPIGRRTFFHNYTVALGALYDEP